MTSFVNEPTLELRRAPVRDQLVAALAELDQRVPLAVPILIGGDRGSASGLVSTDPGAPDRVVAEAGSGSGGGKRGRRGRCRRRS